MNLNSIVQKYEKLDCCLLQQNEFLEKMGMGFRLENLIKDFTDEKEKKVIEGEYDRLVNDKEMGKVYKFMYIGKDLVFPFGEM